MQTTKLGFKISATDALLDLAVVLDGQSQWQGRPGTDVQEISVEFEDADDQTHVLEFILSGKIPEHTRITDQGEITSDVTIQIRDISFDDIAIDQIFLPAKGEWFADQRMGKGRLTSFSSSNLALPPDLTGW